MKKSDKVKAQVKKINAMCREPLIVNGVKYDSVRHACETLKITRKILRRLIATNPSDCFFLNARKSPCIGKKQSLEWRKKRSEEYKSKTNIQETFRIAQLKHAEMFHKKVEVNGTRFDSAAAAAKYLNVTPPTILRHIKLKGITKNPETGYYHLTYNKPTRK